MTPGHLLPLEQLLQMMHVLLSIFGFAWWSRYSSIPGQVLVKSMFTYDLNVYYIKFDIGHLTRDFIPHNLGILNRRLFK